MGTEAFATFWILQDKTMKNFGFPNSNDSTAAAKHRSLIPAGRNIPEER